MNNVFSIAYRPRWTSYRRLAGKLVARPLDVKGCVNKKHEKFKQVFSGPPCSRNELNHSITAVPPTPLGAVSSAGSCHFTMSVADE
jgi:hypothetical protein